MKHLLVTKTTLVVSTPHLFLAFCLGLEEVQGRRSVHTWSLFCNSAIHRALICAGALC